MGEIAEPGHTAYLLGTFNPTPVGLTGVITHFFPERTPVPPAVYPGNLV